MRPPHKSSPFCKCSFKREKNLFKIPFIHYWVQMNYGKAEAFRIMYITIIFKYVESLKISRSFIWMIDIPNDKTNFFISLIYFHNFMRIVVSHKSYYIIEFD